MFCGSRRSRLAFPVARQRKWSPTSSRALTEPRVMTVVYTLRGRGGAAAASPLISPRPRFPHRRYCTILEQTILIS